MKYTQHYDSPLGGITLASDDEALVGLWFDGRGRYGDGLGDEATERDLPVFAEARRWLDIYFSGREPGFVPQLRLKGTPFRKAVWEILLAIPYGQTVTYGEIADRLRKEKGLPAVSARAVGGAVGHNPVSLIIPCHRVVGAGGRLTGYAGGVERKARLLGMEEENRARYIP